MLVSFNIEIIDAVTRQISCEISQQAFLDAILEESTETGSPVRLEKYVPLTVKPQILQSALEKLVRSSIDNIAKQENFRVVSRRLLAIDPLKENSNVTFSACVAVFPSPRIEHYHEIEILSEYPGAVSENEIDQALEVLRNGESDLLPSTTERLFQSSDEADISFRLHSDTGTTEWQRINFTAGNKIFPQEVESSLSGKKSGESFKIEIVFDSSFEAIAWRGKSATYEIKINRVRKLLKPDLNDEFARGLKIDSINSLAELRSLIKITLQLERDLWHLSSFQTAVVDKVLELNPFEVPYELVEDEVKGLLVERGFIKPGETAELSILDPDFRQKLLKEGLRRVRAQILIDRLVIQENLHTSEAELQSHIRQLAEQRSQPANELQAELPKGELLDFVLDIQRSKVLDFLLRNVRSSKNPKTGDQSSFAR